MNGEMPDLREIFTYFKAFSVGNSGVMSRKITRKSVKTRFLIHQYGSKIQKAAVFVPAI
jgi:hypothetical protein